MANKDKWDTVVPMEAYIQTEQIWHIHWKMSGQCCPVWYFHVHSHIFIDCKTMDSWCLDAKSYNMLASKKKKKSVWRSQTLLGTKKVSQECLKKKKCEIKRSQRLGPLWKLSVEIGFQEALVLLKERS